MSSLWYCCGENVACSSSTAQSPVGVHQRAVYSRHSSIDGESGRKDWQGWCRRGLSGVHFNVRSMGRFCVSGSARGPL